MPIITVSLRFGFLAILVAVAVIATGAVQADAPAQQPYVFGWAFVDPADLQPRGATTRGLRPVVDAAPSAAWQALQEAGLSGFERDRRAILAMAGEYRVSFDFLEIAGFTEGYQPARPYRSWGTEFIEVIEDQAHLIVLQHVLVLFIEDDQGNVSEPIVTKHWRQDWEFEAEQMHVYAGNGQWQCQRLQPGQRQGRWVQSVYQVDDSPRYAASGVWEHAPGRSSWLSETTWRPLPRREFTVRDDYQVLIGSNRHTITPSGWIHEQNNLKAALTADGERQADLPYLAQEISVNRYDPIVNYDFSAGREYWTGSRNFWALVRDAWAERFRQHDRLQVNTRVDDQHLFARLFAAATQYSGDRFERPAARKAIEHILSRHVEPVINEATRTGR